MTITFICLLFSINQMLLNSHFDVAASFTSVEILNFMVEELEKTATNDEIKKHNILRK